MNINFGSLKLKFPYISASGCSGYGYETENFFPNVPLNWGAVTTKTITVKPREGNPPPRIFETDGGIINRIGLQNCGLELFLKKKMPKVKKLPYPAVVSIFGQNPEEWIYLARTLSENSARSIELNLSCPNLKGEVLTKNPVKCSEIALKVKESCNIPVWAKINAVDNPQQMAEELENAGIDAIVCSNTIPGAAILNGKIYSGGLSGPAIKPVALKAVYNICSHTDMDVAACGGISSFSDIADYRRAGARAFVIGTAILKRPDIVNIISRQEEKSTGSEI